MNIFLILSTLLALPWLFDGGVSPSVLVRSSSCSGSRLILGSGPVSMERLLIVRGVEDGASISSNGSVFLVDVWTFSYLRNEFLRESSSIHRICKIAALRY
jgi:hypothetical protein